MGNAESTAPEPHYGEPLENDVRVPWSEVVAVVDKGQPGERDGHCACSLNGKLYVFGGVVHPQHADDEISESNDLFTFDIESKEWSKVKVTGDLPAPRSAAVIETVGSHLYLFGGLSRNAGWFDTLHKFDPETCQWSLLEAEGTSPSPRDKLASAVIGQKIYMFGGFGPQGMEDDEEEELSDEEEEDEGAQFGWFNDLYIFDTATSTWNSPMQMNLGCPSPRAAHGMCAVNKYLVIFGGRDANARRSDLHIFDTESRKWLKDLVIQGRQPEPRSFHTVTAVGNRVVVLGGRGVKDQHFQDFHILDTETRHWLQPSLSGNQPAARGCHTATVVGQSLVVFGGSGEFSADTLQCTKYYNDIYTADTDSISTGESWLPVTDTKQSDNNEKTDLSSGPISQNAEEQTDNCSTVQQETVCTDNSDSVVECPAPKKAKLEEENTNNGQAA